MTGAQQLTSSLLFTVGETRCRLELNRLHRVAPWAELEARDEADPPDLLGWLNLQGDRIPIVDVGAMVYGTPAKRLLGARILLLECPSAASGKRLVGVLASEVFAIGAGEEVGAFERFDPCELLSSFLGRLPR